MNKKNVTICKSLESYEKKYKNRKHRLLKYSKKDVDAFDKSNNTKGFLLKDRKWVLIKDTYYEIPKAPRLTWFRNLSAGVQASICLLGAGVVATAITVPTVLLNMNKGGHVDPTPVVDREVVIDEDCKDAISYKNMKITDDGLECVITPNSDKVTLQDDIVVKIDELILNKDVDYTYDYKTGALLINKSALDEHKGKIVISPLYAVKATKEEVEEEITQNNVVLQAYAANNYQYSLSAYAVTSSSGNSMSAVSTNNYFDNTANEYKTDLTIRDDDTGDEYTVTTVGGFAGGGFSDLCDVLVDYYGEDNVSTNMVGGCGVSGGSAVTAYDPNTGDLAEQYLFGQNGMYGMQNDSTHNQLLTFWVDSNAERVAIKDIGEYKDLFVKDEDIVTAESFIAVKKADNFPSSFTTLNIPEKVLINKEEVTIETISDFGAISNLKSVNLPCTIKTIRSKAFCDCSSLASVTIDNNSLLKLIGSNAFAQTNISSFTVPSSVTTIEPCAFDNCKRLFDVYFTKKTGWETIESRTACDVSDSYQSAIQLRSNTYKMCGEGITREKAGGDINLEFDNNNNIFMIQNESESILEAGKTYNIIADYTTLGEGEHGSINHCVFNGTASGAINLYDIVETFSCVYIKDKQQNQLNPGMDDTQTKLYFDVDADGVPTDFGSGKIVLTVKVKEEFTATVNQIVFARESN